MSQLIKSIVNKVENRIGERVAIRFKSDGSVGFHTRQNQPVWIPHYRLKEDNPELLADLIAARLKVNQKLGPDAEAKLSARLDDLIQELHHQLGRSPVLIAGDEGDIHFTCVVDGDVHADPVTVTQLQLAEQQPVDLATKIVQKLSESALSLMEAQNASAT